MPSYQTSKYPVLSWLVLFMAFCCTSCSSTQIIPTAPQPTITPPPQVTTSKPTLALTATSAPAFTPSMTQTPTASATPLLPAYYVQHPALMHVTSSAKPDPSWQLQWIDDTHAAIRTRFQPENQWAEYFIPQNTAEIRYLKPITIETQPYHRDSDSSLLALIAPFDIPGKIDAGNIILSPDKQMVLVVTRISRPTVTLKLGKKQIVPYENLYYEGWIVDLTKQKAQALFYTPEDFVYYWLNDRQYIMATDTCYGGNEYTGQGSFAIDAQGLKINELGNDFRAPCEGGTSPKISPDSLHIIFQNDHGTIQTMQGTQRVRICSSPGGPSSYDWSADGRYVFAACVSDYEQPHELRRYDTHTNKVAILTDQNKLPFKAIRLVVSPDQTRILFEWGNSSYGNTEPYGIWLLDLQKLDHP